MTFDDFLENERKLCSASAKPSKLQQRFFELSKIEAGARDGLQQREFEASRKALRAKWKLQEADAQARNLIGRIDVKKRRTDNFTKIIIAKIVIDLAKSDIVLRHSILVHAAELPSIDMDYLKNLIGAEHEMSEN